MRYLESATPGRVGEGRLLRHRPGMDASLTTSTGYFISRHEAADHSPRHPGHCLSLGRATRPYLTPSEAHIWSRQRDFHKQEQEGEEEEEEVSVMLVR